MGGYNDSEFELSSCEMFDLQRNKWQRIASLSKRRYWVTAASHNDTVFLFGGYTSEGVYCDEVEEYSVSEDKWTVLDARMSIARCKSAAACVNNRIYLIGGCVKSSNSAAVDCFSTETRTFVTVASLPVPCEGTTAASVRVSSDALSRLCASE